MSPKYRFSHPGRGLEKAPLSQNLIAQGQAESERRPFFSLPLTDGGSFLGSTASGVADCLVSLSSCQPSTSPETPLEYDAVMTTVSATPSVLPESRQYVENGSYAGASRATDLGQANLAFNDGFPSQPANWLSDDNTQSSQFMQSYPAMQPTLTTSAGPVEDPRLAKTQPNTHFETMYYPNEQIPPNSYSKPEASDVAQLSSIPPTTLSVSMAPAPAPQIQNFLGEVPAGNRFSPRPLTVTAETQYTMPSPILIPAAVPFDVSNIAPAQQAPLAVPLPSTSTTIGMPQSVAVVPYPNNAAPPYTAPMLNTVIKHHSHRRDSSHVATTPCVTESTFDMPIQRHPRPPAARRGPFKDQTERQKTAQTRKDGCCIRCRMQRIRCNAEEGNPKGVCLGCKNSLGRTWRLPCLRLKVTDVILSKTTQVKGHEWTLRWKENTVLDDVGHWASSEVRILRISEGYTNEFVELRVRKFVPQDGDSLERSWVTPKGETRSVQIPPYAVIEPEAIAPQYSAYIKRGLVACCSKVLADHKDSVLWPTYWIAVKLTHAKNHLSEDENKLLAKTLELWMTVRLTTRSFEIVGEETLGMPMNILDETSPSHGKIPIPPVMGAQLDSVLIHEIQNSLRHDVLGALQDMFHNNKINTWFTTYLVTFMLLHNASLVIKHDASYARKHGLKRRFAREDKVKQYYTGAITLLAYFHYCNKGAFPFTETAREQDIRNLANLDQSAMGIVRHTRMYAIDQKAKWQAVLDTNDYENEFYFISQLYEVNWQPRTMVI